MLKFSTQKDVSKKERKKKKIGEGNEASSRIF
jgi:hypothetical protein